MSIPLPLRHIFWSALVRTQGLLLLGFLVGVTGTARAFQTPNFEVDLFSRDGLFLPAEERDSLLSALTALAVNFSDDEKVDDHLREKALALALRIAPLHHGARKALLQLNQGITPEATTFFETLSSLSEVLWITGMHLLEPPLNPDGKQLAPYLLELSLLTRPQPPQDRLAQFGFVCGASPPDWKGSVSLEEKRNPSIAQLARLFDRSQKIAAASQRKVEIAAARAQAKAVSARPASPSDADTPGMLPGIPTDPIRPISTTLPSVVQTASSPSNMVQGIFTLIIRQPVTMPERRMVYTQLPLTELPLVASTDGFPMNVPAITTTFATEHNWNWPAAAVGELRFEAAANREPLLDPPLLPTLILIESALSEKPINEVYSLIGQLDPNTFAIVIPPNPVGQIVKAREREKPFLLVPDAILDALVEHLQRTEELEILFHPEMIAYSDFTEAMTRMTSPTDPGLADASTAFAEMEEASSRLPLPDLARHQSAQEKLQALLAAYPAHLSARAMLEFGSRPVDPQVRIAQFAQKLDRVMQPFITIEDDGTPFNEPSYRETFDEADRSLVKLGAEAPAEVKKLFNSARDLIGAVLSFAETSNKTSSIAAQRLREAKSRIEAYEAERSQLLDQ